MSPRSAGALAGWGAVLALGLAACGPSQVAVPGKPAGFTKSSPTVRSARRLYDGAPPTIPHAPVGASCTECHNERGLEVPGLGYAPPSPHERTRGLSAVSRCQQCHVFATTEKTFRPNAFVGLPQDLGAGRRLYAGAPPVLPHPVFMRENCAACHTGPAAREEIRTSHPERQRCQQCHVGQSSTQVFRGGRGSGT
jgi:nitrate reductase (cytochrome), electron transfer subunit